MLVKNIIIGKHLRFKDHPDCSYFKPTTIYKPKEFDKKYNYYLVKGEHTVSKNDLFGFIRFFKPCDLIKALEN